MPRPAEGAPRFPDGVAETLAAGIPEWLGSDREAGRLEYVPEPGGGPCGVGFVAVMGPGLMGDALMRAALPGRRGPKRTVPDRLDPPLRRHMARCVASASAQALAGSGAVPFVMKAGSQLQLAAIRDAVIGLRWDAAERYRTEFVRRCAALRDSGRHCVAFRARAFPLPGGEAGATFAWNPWGPAYPEHRDRILADWRGPADTRHTLRMTFRIFFLSVAPR
ncbi:MAG: hypothetical protein LBR80_01680 [Deltaproteobacteria bacterium]|jgi:hypothetical protein|nr:hypothetical protein [Deltaproteobacteria bacterium]